MCAVGTSPRAVLVQPVKEHPELETEDGGVVAPCGGLAPSPNMMGEVKRKERTRGVSRGNHADGNR